jgi:NAD(P)-dependent dehydrogenase (short-subunit alcohol dehydrogenase family)
MAKRNVLITGAASGIGEAMARRFAADDDNVIVVDKEWASGERVAKEIGGTFKQCDVICKQDVERLRAWLPTQFEFLHILIPNVGANNGLSTDQTEREEWDDSIQLNLSSVFYTIKATLPRMPTGGRIIITSSLTGLIGQGNSASYTAAKAGSIGYVKALAIELAPRKITVNAIAPGDVVTSAYDTWLRTQEPEARQKILDGIPLRRFATLDEIAATAFHLASENAAFITGQVIVIDGGKSLGK